MGITDVATDSEETRPQHRIFTRAWAILVAAGILISMIASAWYLVDQTAPLVISGSVKSPIEATDCPALDTGASSHKVLFVQITAEAVGSRNCWGQNLAPAVPGERVKFLITYRNTSASTQHDVAIGANLPPRMDLVPNSTFIANSKAPRGIIDPTNHIADGGIDVGSYRPGANAYVEFTLAVPPNGGLQCGDTTFRAVGVVQPKGFDAFYNTVFVDVTKSC